MYIYKYKYYICIYIHICIFLHGSHEKKNFYFPLYWLVYPHKTGVGFHQPGPWAPNQGPWAPNPPPFTKLQEVLDLNEEAKRVRRDLCC